MTKRQIDAQMNNNINDNIYDLNNDNNEKVRKNIMQERFKLFTRKESQREHYH